MQMADSDVDAEQPGFVMMAENRSRSSIKLCRSTYGKGLDFLLACGAGKRLGRLTPNPRTIDDINTSSPFYVVFESMASVHSCAVMISSELSGATGAQWLVENLC